LSQKFKGQLLRRRHVPQRTCVACRETKSKKELIRVVRTPDGSVKVAISGKESGRGAYLCLRWECWELGIKKNRLEHALRAKISLEDRQRLLEDGANLLKRCFVES